MRLVDANTLKLAICNAGFEHFKAGGCNPNDGAIPVAEAMNLCKAAPTIDAIPVEWLRKWPKDLREGAYIRAILRDWQKEQESQNG